MKFVSKGKFSGNEEDLPQRDTSNAVPFKEAKDMKTLAVRVNIISIVILFILSLISGMIIGMADIDITDYYWEAMIGMALSFVAIVPHEFLHGICFKGEVFMFENLAHGMFFVVGTEDMSKARFIFMSLLPNIVFGLIPFLIFLINPHMILFGVMGLFSLAAGAGDYYNVFNALTQVPKYATVFLSGMHSYWYEPDKMARTEPAADVV